MKFEKLFYVITSTILITIFLLFTFILSPGTYQSATKSKEKTIYYVDHISTAHQKIIDIFNERYKGQLKVETINLSFDKFSTNERKDLLARYLRSKSNRIDLFTVDIIWVPRFKKWSLPLNNYIDSSLIYRLLPHTLKTCIFEDTIFAIPLYTDVGLMYYRDDILKKLRDYEYYKMELEKGITWEKFFELKQKLERETNFKKPFYIFQADKYEGLMCSFIETLSNFNYELITETKQLNLQGKEIKKTFQFFIDLVNKYRLSPLEVTHLRENESYKYFSDNNAFAVRGWPSFLSEDNKYVRKEILSKIKRAPTPYFSNTRPASIFGGWNLMVSKYSDKIPEVTKFIEFLLSPEAQKILYEEGGYLPVISNLYEEKNYVNYYEDLKFYKKLFERGVLRPIDENYTIYSDIISTELNRAILNGSPSSILIDRIIKNLTRTFPVK